MLIEPRQVAREIITHMLRLRQPVPFPRVADEDARHLQLFERDKILFGLGDRYVHVLRTMEQNGGIICQSEVTNCGFVCPEHVLANERFAEDRFTQDNTPRSFPVVISYAACQYLLAVRE